MNEDRWEEQWEEQWLQQAEYERSMQSEYEIHLNQQYEQYIREMRCDAIGGCTLAGDSPACVICDRVPQFHEETV